MKRQRRLPPPAGGCIGVDPGSSSGAIAYVVDGYAQAWPLKNMTDAEVWWVLQKLGQIARIAVLERVNAMPKQGVSSTFKFGNSFGGLRMALTASGTPFQLVTPSKWQGALNCRTGGDKKITRDLAQRTFPSLKVTNQTADALLLCVYADRFLR